MTKVLDFINEYSAVIALGIMVVGLIVLIIFKVVELKRIRRDGDRVEDSIHEIRICVNNMYAQQYSMIKAIRELNDTVKFQGNVLRDIVSTDFATYGNATHKELHAIHKLLKKEAKKG